MNAVISPARRLLIAFAVLLGLLAPMFVSIAPADASTTHRTCSYGRAHAWYRNAHPYWWTHHCPKMAAALRGVAAASVSRPAVIVRGNVLEQKIAWAVGAMINRERVANGIAPVGMEPHLVVSAMRHNWQMARFNTMSHQLPGEASLGDRIDAAGYHWMWAGENVAWNSQMDANGVLALQSMMYNEKAPNDGHRQNILNAHFKHVGINVYMDTAHHKIWLTTDFGSL